MEEVVFELKRTWVTICILKPCLTGLPLFPWTSLIMSPSFRLYLTGILEMGFLCWDEKKKFSFFAVYSGKNDHVFSLSLPAKTKKRVKKSIICFLALSWLAMQNNASDPGILEDFSRKIKVKFSYFVFSFSEELIIYWIRLFSLVMLYLVKDILPVAEMLFD